jgi:hypothetical protein
MFKSLKCDDTADAPDAMVCRATLLRHNFLLMTKQFRTDGEVIGYSLGKMFDMSDLVLRGLDRVLDMLDGVQGLTNMCVIRGELINPPRVFRQRRLLQKKGDGGTATLKDVPRRWVALDFDSIAAPDDLDRRDLIACAKVAEQILPKEFHGRRAVIHATSSHMVKPGIRVRLWYWLDRPTFGYELKRWLGKRVSDHSVLNPVEPIYCAAPLFENPAMNPLKERLADMPGLPVVKVPAATTLAPKSHSGGANRAPVKVPDTDDIKDLVYAVASQTEGNRNNNLFRCACKVGTAVALGRMGMQQAFDVLVDAVLHSGLERQEAEATVSSGLQSGIHAVTAADPFEDAANTFTAEIPDAEVR